MEKSKVIIDNEVWLPRRISEFFFLISFLVLLDGKHPLYAAERIHQKKKKGFAHSCICFANEGSLGLTCK